MMAVPCVSTARPGGTMISVPPINDRTSISTVPGGKRASRRSRWAPPIIATTRSRRGMVSQQSLYFGERLGGVSDRHPAFELVHVQHVVREMIGEQSDHPITGLSFTGQGQAPVVSHKDRMYTAIERRSGGSCCPKIQSEINA